MNIAIGLSGFFFLFIIATNLLSGAFGYQTFSKLDSRTQFKKINVNLKKFKISFIFIIVEHIYIICLAISLFIAFSSYNVILGIIWLSFRSGEALIQIYDKKNYLHLFHLAEKYLNAKEFKKDELVESGDAILKRKNQIFTFSQILFSIGTFSYSLLFALYEVVSIFIGWFGVISSIIYGCGNIIYLIKSGNKSVWNIGGILILIFESILGIWLLISSFL
ncbi:MAG: DUF4386 family protein [Candidatus Lokiarchaeota archaeon]|nr:DUF4386 family protein [Candidatus Lokiarchaeota archaeon]MBD3341584.1 DUF4386 family protein [Candidatus Lokiarchaeota archaeon]